MTKEGKIVLGVDGETPLVEEGEVSIFDDLEESCCCTTDPEDPDPEDPQPYCPLRLWGAITPPAGSLYPYSIDPALPLPACAHVTFGAGTPFAGTYALKAGTGINAGSWSGRRTAIASANYTFKGSDYNAGSPINPDIREANYPIWSGGEYEFRLSVSVGVDGELKLKLRFNLATPYNTSGEYEKDGSPSFGEVVNYYTTNIFDQPSLDWQLTPTPVYLYPPENQAFKYSNDEWLATVTLSDGGEELRNGGGATGCACEWTHNRYIDHPTLINSDSNVGSSWQMVLGDSQYFEPPTPYPFLGALLGKLDADSFDGHNGNQVETGSKMFSCVVFDERPDALGPSSNTEGYEEVIYKRVPFHFGNDFNWAFELAHAAQNRTTTTPQGFKYQGWGAEVGLRVALGDVDLSLFIGHLAETYNYFSDPAIEAGLITYGFSAVYPQLNTETPPDTDGNYLNPWGLVMPDETVGTIKMLYYGLNTQEIFGEGGRTTGATGVRGLIYRTQLIANGQVLKDEYQDIGLTPWRTGEFTCSAQGGSGAWAMEEARPKFFTDFGGFDDTFPVSYGGTIANSSNYYEAPENCGRVAPEILLTSQGTIDAVTGEHEIIWHVGEDISTTGIHKAFDRKGAMTPEMYLTGFAGFLPLGVTMDETGLMTGTPTEMMTGQVKGTFTDYYGFDRCSWILNIVVKVRDPAFQYDPNGFVSGGTNTEGVDWYMRDGDSGTIEADAHWGTTPYVMSYTGDALDGASFDVGTGDWVLSGAHTQIGDSSGTVNMKLLDDTNKTNFVTKTWYRKGT